VQRFAHRVEPTLSASRRRERAWATVNTGLFGTKHSFVPIAEAELTDDDKVRVPFQKEQVKNAPKVDADGELSPRTTPTRPPAIRPWSAYDCRA